MSDDKTDAATSTDTLKLFVDHELKDGTPDFSPLDRLVQIEQ